MAASESTSLVWELLEIGSSGVTVQHPLKIGSNTIGRSTDCSVYVPSDKLVSMCHCQITCSADTNKPILRDTSTNGTFVNGIKLTKDECKELSNGDVVHLAPATAVMSTTVYRVRLREEENQLNNTEEYDCHVEDFDLGRTESVSTQDSAAEMNGPPTKRRMLAVDDDAETCRPKPTDNEPSSSSAGQDAKDSQKIEQFLVCSICQDIFHKCVSAQPCMHSFCASCFSSWLDTSSKCPMCRKSVTRVAKNHTVNSLVEVYLQSHPEKKRSDSEIKEMDDNDKIKSDSMPIGTMPTPDFPDDDSYNSNNSEEEYSEEDYYDDGGGSEPADFAAAMRRRASFTAGIPLGLSICRQCPASQALLPANDPLRSFTCAVGQVHLMCHCCYQSMPDRRHAAAAAAANTANADVVPPVSCAVCHRFFCGLYWNCRSVACQGCLRLVKDFEFGDDCLRDAIRGNLFESNVVENYLRGKSLHAQDLFKDCVTKIEGDASLMPAPWQISTNDPLCRPCGKKLFQDLAYVYRKELPRSELPAHVTQRGDCYWGKNCRTQTHNFSHASRYNHVCDQTRFS